MCQYPRIETRSLRVQWLKADESLIEQIRLHAKPTASLAIAIEFTLHIFAILGEQFYVLGSIHLAWLPAVPGLSQYIAGIANGVTFEWQHTPVHALLRVVFDRFCVSA